MIRRIAWCALLVVGLGGCGETPRPAPNVLVVTLDTTRADRFGFAGYEKAGTPNFDRFAAERAVWFQNAISAVPVTFPSHTSIMTGTYPVFHGVHDNDGYFLDDRVTTLAERLREEGMTTGAVVAAFPLDSEVNLDQGFETYDDDYQADWSEAERAARGPLSFGFLERKADRVNMAVDRWLTEHERDRFFLWVHYFDPHQPYNPPAPFDSRFSGDPYDGEMAFMDEQFGKLLDMLDRRGLTENTIIVVVGDHGEGLDEHGEPTHAHFIYDATIRVPLLMAVPGDRFPAGSRVPPTVRTVDIAPTILDLLGLEPGADMQGRTLVPLMTGAGRDWSEAALIENYYNMFHFGWAPLRGLRTDRFKFIEAPAPELYDLEADPGELTNLAGSHPADVEAMRGRLQDIVGKFEVADLGRSTAAQVDDETRSKLEALGYVSAQTTVSERSAPFPDRADLAARIDPKDRSLILRYVNFLNELMRAQRFDEAVPVARKALALDPDNVKLHLQLARSLAAIGSWENALATIDRALELRPDNVEALVIAGRIQVIRGRPEEALPRFEKAVDLAPHQAGTLQQLAGCLHALGRPEEAIPHFEAVLELDDGNVEALGDLADAYFRTDRWEEAREALQRALALRPYSARIRYRIGVFYRDTGNADFARKIFEEALRINPDFVAAHVELGEVLEELGDRQGARFHFERVIELVPDSSMADQAKERLNAFEGK